MGPAHEQAPGTTVSLLPDVRRTVLPGGLRVVTEHVPGVRSAAIGVFVGVGSRDEVPALSGASHFLEHLLFKGTPERSAMEISAALDGVGGELNAYTSREYTCYHARVLDEDLPLAVDVLGDMLTASRITAADVEAEREVILDEIAMHDDDPDDVVHELVHEHAWAGTPLGRPVAGRPETVAELTRAQVHRYYRTRYAAPATTVAVAGNVDHESVVELVRSSFSRHGFLEGTAGPAAPRPSRRTKAVRGGLARATRHSEQVNLVLAVPGIVRSDPRRYAVAALNAALGGGPSSRLFQQVREERGLAYSVYSFAASYSDAGLFAVAAGCLPGKVDDVLTVVRAELAEVARDGLDADELVRAKGQLRGGMVMGLEDTASRMSRLGEAELFHERLLGLDDVLERVDAVGPEDIAAVAGHLLTGREVLATVGPE
ncbi:putative zinc protease [Marmoricola endophyticus]|uniref:Zinc protease n=1 Tax=Marmoricola endophyticus TaxID=2040280 RepID=A0A917BFJ9_9ACTN|nr:pitrilysin family protein [Marmoricola endophyticus]GGF38383.1 putative zinc protease [Marmoricola endophyticus]